MSELTFQKLVDAIKKTDYKYFGDYEMTEEQRDAVGILVDAAIELMVMSASRQYGWISAKNNTPPKSCQVIAEWSNGDIEQSSYITDWGKPHFQRKCGTDENGTGWTGNVGYVINWMPLPNPTKGDKK